MTAPRGWLLARLIPLRHGLSMLERASLVLVAVAAVAILANPAAADAHLRTGTVAVDYRATVLTPDTSAYAARIYQSDRGLSLTLKPGHVVVVLGYLGEPMFRLDASGLWVNAASPTAVVAGLLTKGQRSDASTPRWRLERGRDSAVWHDTRLKGLPPGLDHGAWSVPLIVDGRRRLLEGYLTRFPAPSLLLWLGGLASLLGAGASPLLLRQRELVRAGAIGCAFTAAAASVLIALVFALDTYASAGTWIEGLDEIAFLAVGLGVLLRGPENLHVGAAIGTGLVAMAVGLSKGAIFIHPIVLAILPGTVTRLLAVAAIGAGLAAAVLGCAFYAETTAPLSDSQTPARPAVDQPGG
jgi:hypothetical protein